MRLKALLPSTPGSSDPAPPTPDGPDSLHPSGALKVGAEAATETPAVATAEARAAAPARVSSIAAVARSRLKTVAAETLLVEVAAKLASAQIGLVMVCAADGTPLGSITETLLVKRLGQGEADFSTTRADAVMTHAMLCCAPEDGLSEVLAAMHQRGLVQVLVVDARQHPWGVVNASDGLRALLAAGNQEEALLRNYVMGTGYQ